MEQVRAELADALEGAPPAARRGLLSDAEATRRACAAAIRNVWRAVLASEWPALKLVLDSDLLHRGQALTRGGTAGMISDLHADVQQHGQTVQVRSGVDIDVICNQGLLLVPTVFITDRVQCTTADHWPPTLYYPARGAWSLWEPPPPPKQLGALLGNRRAQILVSLTVPRTTGGVAELIDAAPATASEHLSILRNSGLVSSRRLGRQMIHSRTSLGEALAEGPGT